MGINVPLVEFRPPPRYDATVWTHVEMAEADGPDGTFTTRDTQPLNPLDVDAENPITRNFSTTEGTLEEGWWKVRFTEGANVTPWSAPVFISGLIPLASEIREWSLVDFDTLGFPVTPQGDKLQRLVTVHADWVQRVTGLQFSAETDGENLEAMRNAVKLAVEYAAYRSDPDFIEGAADFDIIKSFTAGSYSETRRDMGAARGVIHPLPELNDILIGLGATAGSGGFPEVGHSTPDWERTRYIIDAGRPPWLHHPAVGARGWI